ncbi:MAG: hypothetical protein A3J74_06710 [Elusimicrobia bacterium RIFCSPHIGHO2_02_FULL_57_9]|nr:MAG: hypothetical protein A3J74_06710 [Elusimicrobia bacterium RIFCSPHIGHO2_02_FULL_57_9]
MRGDEFFRKILRKQGVEYVFGIPGREAQAIRLWGDGLRWILVRNEFSAAIAAEVFARLKGRPQVAFSTFGPGATNLTTGVASAFMDRSPLLAVSAQVERKDCLYGLTHQCLDQVSLMRPLVKFAAQPRRAMDILPAVEQAMAAALAEPRGASYLSIPIDVFSSAIPTGRARRLISAMRPARSPAASPPGATAMERVFSAIANSRQPIIVAGNEIIRSGACKELAAFCEKFNIPVLQSLAAKGVLPEAHPLNFGPVNRYLDGLLGVRAVAGVFQPADLVILAGHDLAEDVRPELWASCRVLRLGLGPNPAPRYLKTDFEAVGGLRQILSRLLSPRYRCPPKPPHPFLKILRATRRKAAQGKHGPRSRLFPCRIVYAIRQALGPEGIFVSDVGLHKQYAGLFSETVMPNTFLCSNGLGTFGFGLAASIGAQLARPNRRVIALVGDGGFHSSSQDLETLARYGLPVVIVVLSDSAFGLIKHYRLRGGWPGGRELEFSRVDFPKLAEANGCRGLKVENIAGFPAALKRALDSRRPALIEVPVSYRHHF